MNISRKCIEFWNKLKKAGGTWLRAFLVIVGVAGALFTGHELDAHADNVSLVTKALHVDVNFTVTDCLGIESCPSYLHLTYRKGDNNNVEYWEEDVCELDGVISSNGDKKDIKFEKDCNISVPGEGWTIYGCEIRSRDNSWMQAALNPNGGSYNEASYFTIFAGFGTEGNNVSITNSTDYTSRNRRVVYKTLKVNISYEGEDVTDNFSVDGSISPQGNSINSSDKSIWLKINSLKIKKKDDAPASIPEFSENDYCIAQGGSSFSCGDDNAVSVNGYDGSDLVFSDFKTVYFTSATAGQENSPWQNELLSREYEFTSQTDLTGICGKVSVSDDFNKGAWKMIYAASKVSEDFDVSFKCRARDHYEFENAEVTSESSSVTVKGGDSAPSLSDDKKELTFGIDVKQNANKLETVKIGGQKYTEYINAFGYANSSFRLMDMVEAKRYVFIAFLENEVFPDETTGGLKEVWTIGDVGYHSDINKLYAAYLISPKEGYAIDTDVEVKVNGEPLERTDDELTDGFYVFQGEDYPRGVLSICHIYDVQDNSITIDNIKKYQDVKFDSDYDSVKNYIQINNGASNWNESIIRTLPLNDQFRVDLRLTDDRRTFKVSANDIASAIRAANQDQTDLSGLICTKNSDTSITLTIPHSTSERTIKIPDNIFEWKKTSASFSIDCSFVDKIYEDQTLRGLKLYKGTDTNPQTGELIELKKGSDSTLVNEATQSGISYDNLIYTLVVEGDAYADLTNAKVSLDSSSVDGEVEPYEGNTGARFTFRLNPSCVGANYRSNVNFQIGGIESSLKKVFINLCPKAILYFVNSDETTTHIATAPDDFNKTVEVGVPSDGGANYVVLYPDYSKTFDASKVVGDCVDNQETVGFNRVKFHINPTTDDLNVHCLDPDATAPPVKFTPIEGVNYYEVTGTGDEKKINYEAPIQGIINITNGKEYSFAVQCNEGYDPNTLEIRANDIVFGSGNVNFTKEEATDDSGKLYHIFTISEDAAIYPITITGSVRAAQLQIYFETSLVDGDGRNLGKCGYIYNGASVSGNLTVIYGQSMAFEVTLPGNCNQSDIVVKFKDGNPLNKINGRYVLNDITSSGNITVENVSLNNYPVNFASNSKAKYKNKDDSNLNESTKYVAHGESFEFKVQPNAGYTMGQDSVVYAKYADGTSQSLVPTNDVYKIDGSEHKGMDQACTISIENVEDIVYTIKLIPADGVTYLNDVDNVIKDIAKIKHGRNFEFSVSLSDEYDDSLGGMNIIVNDGKSSQSSAQKLASGRYVIPNVSEDITIKVGNVRKNTYTVTLTGAEGIDYYNSSGKTITGDNQVEHHSDFSFKVELYPAYKGSDITVMLGDTPMKADGNGFYTISKISESKTVTVVGIEMNDSSELVNRINNLPDKLSSLEDVDDVIEATKAYEALSNEEKALIGNVDKLKALQEQAKEFHHVSNDVRISGVDWYIKLVAIPITDDADACGRIYKKLGSEYILSLYNVYLWNTLTDSRYTLPEGQSAVITLPTPDMTYFEKPTAIHEKNTGKIEFINASINNETTTFQTDSFSPMGIVANRSSTPGRSSLLDATDANLDAISNFAASLFGNEANKVTRSNSSDSDYNDLSGDSGEDDDTSGNIDEKFRSRNNKVTTISSALRLILVLMILVLIGLMIYFFIKRRKDKEDMEKE